MKHSLMKTTSLIMLMCLCSLTITAQTRYHVNQTTGNDGNDGKTWSKAFVAIQMALENAKSGDEIWVTAGTYLPTKKIIDVDNEGKPVSDRYKSFVIPAGVKIYGGFPANAVDNTGLDKRDWDMNRTILSGDLNKDDGEDFTRMEDNVYCVVYLLNADESTVIDGFTITGGNLDVWVPLRTVQGSGICAISDGSKPSSPTLQNLIIEGNSSMGGGAGFSNESGGDACPVIKNTIFRKNKSGEYGGALANYGMQKSSPVMENVSIMGNLAFRGGGMWCISEASETSPLITNVLICGNLAKNRAGGAYLQSYQGIVKPVLTNATICGNYAGTNGGGLFCISGDDLTAIGISSPIIRNSVIWGNQALAYDNFLNMGIEGSNPEIQTCLINGLTVLPDKRMYYPFVEAISASYAPTVAGNYRPNPLSDGFLLINQGYNAFVTTTVDLDGNPRIFDTTVDIGAYEYQKPWSSGILATVAEKKIWANAGNVYIRIDEPATIRIYSVEGILLQQINMGEGTHTIALPSGFYIVSLNNEAATKVFVSK